MNETSLVLALRPELVQIEKLHADLTVWPVGIAGKDPRVHASEVLAEGPQGEDAEELLFFDVFILQ